MKPLVLIAALSLVAAPAHAGPVARDIQHYLSSCRAETSTPFVKSPSRSGYYLVGKSGGRYHIHITIQLRYPAHLSDQDFARARDKFEAVKRWISHYYRDYGLHPDIQLDHARYDPSASNPHPTPPEQSFVVYVRQHTGTHMKELYWGVNPDAPVEAQAKIIAHEFSHLLQLRDEYLVASGARSAEEEAGYEDDSLMKNADHPQPRLYLRHIKKILEPLCPPAGTLVAQETVTDLGPPR